MSLMSIMSYEVMPVIEGTTMGSITASTSCVSSRRCAQARASAAALRLMEAKLRKPTELLSRTNVTVEIEGEEKPALVADWIGLIYFA